MFKQDLSKKAYKAWKYAMGFWIVAHLLDFATSLYGTRLAGLSEGNDLLVGPHGEYLPVRAIILVTLCFFLVYYPICKAVQVVFKNYYFGAAIWLLTAFWTYYDAVFNNFALIIYGAFLSLKINF